MAAPIVRGIGAFGSGTTSFTAAVPTGASAPQLGDAMYIVMESTDSTTTAGTPTTPNGGSGNAFNKLFEQTFAAGSSVEPAVSTLTVFGKIVQVGDNANITVSGVGNHCAGAMVVVGNHGLNAITDTVVGTATDHGTSTANVTAPSITVTASSLIITCMGLGDDANDTTNVSGVTNANLASITERIDQTVSTGSGGGVGIYTATCAGTTTGTTEWDHDTAAQSESMQLGIKPMPFQPDDSENGWWAGAQSCFTSVATASLAAIALSANLAWGILQQGNEDYTPPPAAPAWQPADWIAIGSDYVPPAFIADDEIVPQEAPPAAAFEDYWWQPQQQITVTFSSPFWGEDETVPVSPPNEAAWQVSIPPLVTARPLLEFQAQDEAPYPLSIEEVYWYQPATSLVEVTVVDWPVTGVGGGGSPPAAGIVEEDYWFAQRALEQIAQPLLWFEDQSSFQTVIEEDYWWTAPTVVLTLPQSASSAEDEITSALAAEDYWQAFQPEVRSVVQLWQVEDELPTRIDEDYWFAPQAIQQDIRHLLWFDDPAEFQVSTEEDYWWKAPIVQAPAIPRLQLSDEEIVPQPVAFTPDEDYWYQARTDQVEVTVVAWPPTGVGGGGAPLATTIGFTEPDWQVWTPPLLPAKPLYLPDPEQVPAGSLISEQPGGGGYGYTQRLVYTTAFKLWGQADELPTPLIPAPPEEDYWLRLQAYPEVIYAPVFQANEEIVPQPGPAPAHEEYWYRQGIDRVEVTIVNWPAAGTGTGGPTFPAEITVVESDWQVWTPPLVAAKPIYLPDPEQIPASFLSVQQFSHGLGKAIISRAVSAPVFKLWPSTDDFPARTTTEVEDTPWQVYTPPLVAAKGLYLPDPEEVPGNLAAPALIEEEDWRVWTPPLPTAQPIYLPDPIAGETVPQPVLEEPEWQVYTPLPPAPSFLYLPEWDQAPPERTTAGPSEDYWFTLQPQAPVLVATLWNEDDQILPQIVPLALDEEFWQVWTPTPEKAQGLYLPDPYAGEMVPIPPRPPRLYIDITTGQLYLAVQGTETGSPIRLIPL